MAKISVIPARVERFGTPSSCTVVVHDAPTETFVSARLDLPPDAQHAATIRALVNWEWVEVFIEDGGDGPPGTPAGRPIPMLARSEISRVAGDQPIRVLKGTTLDIEMISSEPPADFVAGRGVLRIEGEGWDLTTVPITFLPTNIVTLTSTTSEVSIEQGQEVSFEVTATVLQGRDVTLNCHLVVEHGLEMSPLAIAAVRGAGTTAMVTLRVDIDIEPSDAPFSLRISGLAGRQTDGSIDEFDFAHDELMIDVTITPRPVVVEPDLVQLRGMIAAKYEQVGGFKSRLGLPLASSMPMVRSPDGFAANFRSGTIAVKSDGTDLFATVQTFCEISVVGIQCNIRQEMVDEIYGTVSCLIANTANSNSTTVKIPDDSDGVFEMGPPGLRISSAHGLIYSGPVADVLIAVMLVQQDSGDTSETKKEIAAAVAKAAQAGLSAVSGGGAESMFLSPALLQTISLGLVNAVENLLGLPDDPFNPAYLRLGFGELAKRPHERFILPIDGDAGGEIEYTHSITASGLDGDNDLGKYTVYIDLRTFQQNEKL